MKTLFWGLLLSLLFVVGCGSGGATDSNPPVSNQEPADQNPAESNSDPQDDPSSGNSEPDDQASDSPAENEAGDNTDQDTTSGDTEDDPVEEPQGEEPSSGTGEDDSEPSEQESEPSQEEPEVEEEQSEPSQEEPEVEEEESEPSQEEPEAEEEESEPTGPDPEPEEDSPGEDPEPAPSTGTPVGYHSAPPLPPILNPQVQVMGNTALVTFEPVAGAKDYRVYPMPPASAVQAGSNGQLTVADAIYRCGGDRQISARDAEHTRLSGWVQFYTRSEAEAVLGHVYVSPGTGRVPVWRLGDPAAGADYASGFAYHASRHARYVTSLSERQSLLSQGWRDEGVVFYAPEVSSDTAPVYRWESGPRGWIQNRKVTVYFREGPEYDYRSQNDADPAEFEQPFAVLKEPAPDTVPLYRVIYDGHHDHDVLAAGEARLERALHQGNQPVWFVSWPGMTGATTLVVEALDEGCPFPGHIASESIGAAGFADGYVTLDQARLGSGEVFINGQHHSGNRPKPIARAIVQASPQSPPSADFFAGFNPNIAWDEFTLVSSDNNNGNYHYRSDNWEADFSNTQAGVHTFGPLLGELVVGFADRGGGVNGRFRISPRVALDIGASGYLHARMDADLPSTGRRYPQMMISSVPAPVQGNLEDGTTIVVQPFGIHGTEGGIELQVQFCDHRTWDVNNQCPQNSLGTRRLGWSDTSSKNRPQPLLGELSGFDRKVRLDVYASTQRVYVFLDEQPVGCAILPTDSMAAGSVSVSFGSVLYHSGIDEMVINTGAPHQYLDRHSLTQTTRRFGNLTVTADVSLPSWSHSRFPCGGSGDWQ